MTNLRLGLTGVLPHRRPPTSPVLVPIRPLLPLHPVGLAILTLHAILLTILQPQAGKLPPTSDRLFVLPLPTRPNRFVDTLSYLPILVFPTPIAVIAPGHRHRLVIPPTVTAFLGTHAQQSVLPWLFVPKGVFVESIGAPLLGAFPNRPLTHYPRVPAITRTDGLLPISVKQSRTLVPALLIGRWIQPMAFLRLLPIVPKTVGLVLVRSLPMAVLDLPPQSSKTDSKDDRELPILYPFPIPVTARLTMLSRPF